MSSVTNRVTAVFERVPSLYYQQVFFFLVLGYVSLMMWDARTYSPTVGLFPLLVGVPLIGLLVAQLAYPVLPDRLRVSADGLMERVAEDEAVETGETVDPAVRMRREAAMVGWTLAVLSLTYFFGFLSTLTVFVFGFIYYYERNGKLALGVTVLNLVISYVLFVQILQIRLFPGAIW